MENGDSDSDKSPHRTGHNARHYQLHGTWAVLFLETTSPPTPLQRERGFLFLGVYARRLEKHEGGS